MLVGVQAGYLQAKTAKIKKTSMSEQRDSAAASLKLYRGRLTYLASKGSVKRLTRCKEKIKEAELVLGLRVDGDSSSSDISDNDGL